MNEDKFKIIRSLKDFIILIDTIIINYLKKEYELRNRLVYDIYQVLEYIYEANYQDIKDRKNLQIKAIMKLNIIDFYIEYSYKKKIISEKQAYQLSSKLLNINKMIYKWMHYEKCKN